MLFRTETFVAVSFNRVLESFGRFSCSILTGDVCVHLFAWVVFVCANFVRMELSVKISAHFAIVPDRGADQAERLFSDNFAIMWSEFPQCILYTGRVRLPVLVIQIELRRGAG